MKGTFALPSYTSAKHERYTRLLCWDQRGHDPAYTPFLLTASDTHRLSYFTKEPQIYMATNAHHLGLFNQITGRLDEALRFVHTEQEKRQAEQQACRSDDHKRKHHESEGFVFSFHFIFHSLCPFSFIYTVNVCSFYVFSFIPYLALSSSFFVFRFSLHFRLASQG